jgi:hypothetical protein
MVRSKLKFPAIEKIENGNSEVDLSGADHQNSIPASTPLLSVLPACLSAPPLNHSYYKRFRGTFES